MHTIAIAVRGVNLHLEASVVRKTASDIYLNFHRDHDPTWNPHGSYHASGQFHHKSYGQKFASPVLGQKPDSNFKGTKNMASFGLAAGEHLLLNQPCDPSLFDEVFEIPAQLLRPEKYSTYVYTDLVEPGVSPTLYPGATVLKQTTYKDAEPWIVVTLLHIPTPTASSASAA
jgi:hypothetical protein